MDVTYEGNDGILFLMKRLLILGLLNI
jgi:hypothetical protein